MKYFFAFNSKITHAFCWNITDQPSTIEKSRVIHKSTRNINIIATLPWSHLNKHFFNFSFKLITISEGTFFYVSGPSSLYFCRIIVCNWSCFFSLLKKHFLKGKEMKVLYFKNWYLFKAFLKILIPELN